jgi:SAM-dependent methyltransferase
VDAACGLGGSTRRLAQTYAPEMITGINISEAQIADARALAPGCTFEVMNATELDFPDDHFDGVICIEGACHFDTRDEFFKEAHRVLKPGGSLALADMLFGTTILSEFGQVPRANLLTSIAEYRVRLAAAGFVSIEVTDATEHCLGGFRANLARWAGVERRAGRMTLSQSLPPGDRQAVGRLLRLELQDLSAGLGAQAVLSATMGTGWRNPSALVSSRPATTWLRRSTIGRRDTHGLHSLFEPPGNAFHGHDGRCREISLERE